MEDSRKVLGMTPRGLAAIGAVLALCIAGIAFLIHSLNQPKALFQVEAGGNAEDPSISINEATLEQLLSWRFRRNAEVYAELARRYYHGWETAEGPDLKEAAKWWAQADEQRHAESTLTLGVCYKFGAGVQKDERKALQLFRRAAALGSPEGMLRVGHAYVTGSGTEPDLAAAANWYRDAAEAGNVDGMKALALFYREGYAVPKDHAEEVKWERQAANAPVETFPSPSSQAYIRSAIAKDNKRDETQSQLELDTNSMRSQKSDQTRHEFKGLTLQLPEKPKERMDGEFGGHEVKVIESVLEEATIRIIYQEDLTYFADRQEWLKFYLDGTLETIGFQVVSNRQSQHRVKGADARKYQVDWIDGDSRGAFDGVVIISKGRLWDVQVMGDRNRFSNLYDQLIESLTLAEGSLESMRAK
ncbi:MAG: tetratricopeptide repeat protein [Planctomycetota bacterium]